MKSIIDFFLGLPSIVFNALVFILKTVAVSVAVIFIYYSVVFTTINLIGRFYDNYIKDSFGSDKSNLVFYCWGFMVYVALIFLNFDKIRAYFVNIKAKISVEKILNHIKRELLK